MRRFDLVIAALLILPWQAQAADKKKPDVRQIAIEQVGEAIAIVSLCRGLTADVPTISLTLMRAGLNVDDIFDAAGKYSASIIPQMIESGGEDAACAAGAAWYGPRGSKVPNFLILQ